jgi:lysophospholipase L1-like esterase
VYWILPNPEKFPRQAEDVKLIALSFGDFVIRPGRYQEDQVHPSWAGYKNIVKEAE